MTHPATGDSGWNCEYSAGRYIRLEAKITGMMPAWLTLSGMYVEEPPNIWRPTMRLAYCTGMRRWACSMKMTPATTTRPTIVTMRNVVQPFCCLMSHSAPGNVATTWVKMRIDMPLPMPRSVMSSPSHMMTAVPETIVSTISRYSPMESLLYIRSPHSAPPNSWPLRASATMPVACRIASPSVR